MAAPTSRKRTERVDTTLAAERPVQLQSQRRFFSNQGNDRATREAKAITNAFGAGVDLFAQVGEKKIVEGRAQGITERGAGEDRDQENKNLGYNTAWDQLDAESDLNIARKELPAYLESIDAESLNEVTLQAVVSEYMKAQFDGIEPNSPYGKVLAPGLLALEQGILEEHREGILEAIRVDQMSKIVTNMEDRIAEADGDWNVASEIDGLNLYEYLATQTNTFFDGANKKLAYWETFYDFMIKSGRPELWNDLPEKFADGSQTGKKNAAQLDEHRANIAAATQVQAKRAAQKQAAEDQQNQDNIFELQYQIAAARIAGDDTYSLIRQLAGMPGVQFSDISTAKGFGDSQLDERESRSPDLTFTAPLWKNIYEGSAGLDAIFYAHNNGLLGQGPQAEKLMQSMMATARTVRASRESSSNPDVSVWRNQINRQYNSALKGQLGAINPAMHRINIAANAFYTEQVANGTDAMEAFNATIERFDPILKNTDIIGGAENPLEHRPQSDFIYERILTNEAMTAVADGNISYLDAFAGVPPNLVIGKLVQARADKTLTEDQIALIYSNID